jgi:hypothetical protein
VRRQYSPGASIYTVMDVASQREITKVAIYVKEKTAVMSTLFAARSQRPPVAQAAPIAAHDTSAIKARCYCSPIIARLSAPVSAKYASSGSNNNDSTAEIRAIRAQKIDAQLPAQR